jgi:hypothetical protein
MAVKRAANGFVVRKRSPSGRDPALRGVYANVVEKCGHTPKQRVHVLRVLLASIFRQRVEVFFKSWV